MISAAGPTGSSRQRFCAEDLPLASKEPSTVALHDVREGCQSERWEGCSQGLPRDVKAQIAAMKMDYQKLLVEETPDALIVTSADGKVLHWNRGAETTFGYASAEAVGCSLSELIVPPDRLEEEQAIQRQALETGVATY